MLLRIIFSSIPLYFININVFIAFYFIFQQALHTCIYVLYPVILCIMFLGWLSFLYMYVCTYDDIYYLVYHAVCAVPIYLYIFKYFSNTQIHIFQCFSNFHTICVSHRRMERIYVKLYRVMYG